VRRHSFDHATGWVRGPGPQSGYQRPSDGISSERPQSQRRPRLGSSGHGRWTPVQAPTPRRV